MGCYVSAARISQGSHSLQWQAAGLAQMLCQLSQLHAGLGVLKEMGGQLQRGVQAHGDAVVPVLRILLVDGRLGFRRRALAGLHVEGMQRCCALLQLACPVTRERLLHTPR